MLKSAIEYTKEVGKSLTIHLGRGGNLYEGKEGCLRLAREYGYGLRDYPEKERKDAISSSYSIIVVKGYNLKPPVDAKDWFKEIYTQLED